MIATIPATEHAERQLETAISELIEPRESRWYRQFTWTHPLRAVVVHDHHTARELLSASGSHYYDKDTVRFWRGRTDRHISAGRFWVESVQLEPGGGRRYRVVWLSHRSGDVSVERSRDFATLVEARKARTRLALAVIDAGPTGPDGAVLLRRMVGA